MVGVGGEGGEGGGGWAWTGACKTLLFMAAALGRAVGAVRAVRAVHAVEVMLSEARVTGGEFHALGKLLRKCQYQ